MAIAGPNGAGKSSLLEEIRRRRADFAEPGTEVLAAGAYRTWRSGALSRAAVYANVVPSFKAAMALDMYPYWNGGVSNILQQVGGQPRTVSDADEAQAFVKTSLVKLGDRQKSALLDAWEERGHVLSEGDVPQLLEPFRRLVGVLLPHLEWVGIDDSNDQDLRCLFRPSGSTPGVSGFDIDQLSAGEKAAIALMLPFVEQQAERMLTPTSTQVEIVPITFLIDEPEIHLHPLLQLQVLQYLRELASEGAAQFIITTHSPTLLDALGDEELYLLSPAALSPENQLSRLTSGQERLEVAREITGSTHVLTRAKPIVFVEGETAHQGRTSDARLISQLLPATAAWALVPGRAKHDVTTAVQRLRAEGVHLPGAPVFGLVDADRDAVTGDDHVVSWPVAMVENLLLDPEAMHAVLAPHGAVTKASSVVAVQELLHQVAVSRRDDEVRLRVKAKFKIGRLQLEPDEINSLEAVADRHAAKWVDEMRALDLSALRAQAEADVDQIITDGTYLERFHGKNIFRGCYAALNAQKVFAGPAAFAGAVATVASGGARIQRLAVPAIEQVRLYFPDGLSDLIAQAGPGMYDDLVAQCESERAAWVRREPLQESRVDLRRRLFDLARQQEGEVRDALISLASEGGTP